MPDEVVKYFSKFSDGETTYTVEDEVAQSNLRTHVGSYVNSASGSHGLKITGRVLTYYNSTTSSWEELDTSGGVVELTSAEYQELSEEEKNSNIFYVITDGEPDDQGNPVGVFRGATSLANGSVGIVPAPLAGENDKVLCGDGTWKSLDDLGGLSNEPHFIIQDNRIYVSSRAASSFLVENNRLYVKLEG